MEFTCESNIWGVSKPKFEKKKKKHIRILHKVLFRILTLRHFGIAIMEKQIAFRDRDTLNSNPALCRSFPAVEVQSPISEG